VLVILSILIVATTPKAEAKKAPGGNAACYRACLRGYASCLSGCSTPLCHWRCYDKYLSCLDGCDGARRPGIYYC
jgi:ribosome modulation factor